MGGLCHHEGMKGPLVVPRAIWAALFVSTLIYIVVLELTKVQNDASWQALLYPLAFGAVMTASASLVVPRMVLKQGAAGTRGDASNTRGGRYLTALILALALAESIAIFGLVLGFLGAPPAVVVPFFAVTWILMLIRFPTQEKLDRFGA
jgi:F0F1-type ATP synthase membrane subunit c/vacuolar-type H+-ATPase subunit K